MQACATGVRTLLAAAQEIEVGLATHGAGRSTATAPRTARTSTTRTRAAPGGTGVAEDWVMDNFGCDPLGGHSMLATAENVAASATASPPPNSTRSCCAARRSTAQALADGAAFLKRFMTLPFEVPAPGYKKTADTIEGDEGVSPLDGRGTGASSSRCSMGGTVTYGGADASGRRQRGDRRDHARARARAVDATRRSRVRLHGFGQARAELAYMPEAHGAGGAARARAGRARDRRRCAAIKTHNPFAINDIAVRARQPASTGAP